MTNTKQQNNLITPFVEVELSFSPDRLFKLRKCDLMFDSWCQDNYGSVQNYFTMLVNASNPDADAKKLTYAVIRAFYHLISRDDQIHLRDELQAENPIGEDGEEIKLTLIDKIIANTTIDDITTMVVALMKAKGFASANEPTEEEKKKKSDTKKSTKVEKTSTKQTGGQSTTL